MKKTFPLQEPGLAPARVVERVKHEVRRYVKREHHKALPEGFALWNFACKVGPTAAAAVDCPLGDVSARIEDVARQGAAEVHIEIVATPGHRPLGSETPAGR